jgi:hypothetical protein
MSHYFYQDAISIEIITNKMYNNLLTNANFLYAVFISARLASLVRPKI